MSRVADLLTDNISTEIQVQNEAFGLGLRRDAVRDLANHPASPSRGTSAAMRIRRGSLPLLQLGA